MTDHKTRLADIRARAMDGNAGRVPMDPDVPWLLAEVERLTKDNESLENILSGLARAAKLERKYGGLK